MQGIRAFVAVLIALAVCGTGMALAEDDSSNQLSSSPELPAPSAQSKGAYEIEAKRTATSATFRLPDGALETRLYEAPVHFRDESGGWRPIDEKLKETAGGTLTNGQNSFNLSLPDRMGAEPVRLATDGDWITAELLGPGTEAADVEGAVATYDAADPGVSFELTSIATGVKEEIEIAGPEDPSAFSFELSTSPGVTPVLTDDGSIEFRDEPDDPVAVIPPPVLADSAPGQPAISEAARYLLEPQEDGAWRLTVEADGEWLEQPDRVWPVRLDPTLTVWSPSLDCTIGGKKLVFGYNGWGLCGSGGQKELYARYRRVGSDDEWARSLLRFDLSGLPNTVPPPEITSATLKVHAPSAALNTSGVEVRRVTKDWTKDVNWRNYAFFSAWATEGGDYTAEGDQTLTQNRGSQAGWWEFSGLAPLVQKWKNLAAPNQGLILKLLDEKAGCCQERALTFNSSASVDANLRPYMSVVYYVKAPSSSKVVLPSEGTRTARRLKLKAGWASGVTGVSFQYRLGTTGTFKTMPAGTVSDANGQPVSWPLAVEGTSSPTLYFDAAAAEESLKKTGGAIQVRALFEGPTGIAGYSVPANAKVDPYVGGTKDATTAVGPGQVNLLTGNFVVSRTDVSVATPEGTLEFSRTHGSRDPVEGANTSVLGPGWEPTSPVEIAGGSAWQKITEVAYSEEEAYAVLTDIEGYEYAFEQVGSSYVTPPEAAGMVLSRISETRLALTDPDGNRTTFEKVNGDPEYRPISVTQMGAGGTQMVYEMALNGKRRLKMIIAPSVVACNEENAKGRAGCRSLSFKYEAATKWGAPFTYGERLASITYHAPQQDLVFFDLEVAKYSYDSNGRLVEQWDPRVSPVLKETYTYEGPATQPSLKTLTPPGEEPWTFEYPGGGGAEGGRLLAVKRPSLLSSPSIAQTTIVYGVPISGGGAPYSLSGTAIAQWGQQDIPTDATAIFPPDQVPSNPPSDYGRATVHYIDAEGTLINTATPSGAGTTAPSITTTETDEHGNVVRELSAQNRLRALAAGSGSAELAQKLDTERIYSADGIKLEEERGPLHEVRLESGATVQARMHRTIQYDSCTPAPPAGTPCPYLPIRETTGASIPGQGIDADQRVTETKYNWNLRLPTDTIVDPEGLKLRTHFEYDNLNTSRRVRERRLPANPDGGDARSTRTIYYTAGGNLDDGSCGNRPAWANLPCVILPAKQPGTAGQPDLLVKRFLSYSPLGKPTEILESPGGNPFVGSRKTIITYDAAGRQTSWKQEGGGSALPPIETIYGSTTGRPTSTKFNCAAGCPGGDNQAVTASYDTLGRVTSYQDADSNTSTSTYDLLGRAASVFDGKGTQTFTYDTTSGLLIQLTDSAAGTFTASYDADGNLVERGLPNGLTAQTTYDEIGAPVRLKYEKTTNCAVSCTWLDFEVEESIHGQWLTQTSNLSSQEYSYDKAGRLKLVKDTPQGEGCTTRSYSYDANTNRTALVTRQPGAGGVCDTSSNGTPQTYSYDAGDRLIGSGISYDNFGRITSLPSAYSGGGTLTSSYFSNDLVQSQTQDGITNTYELDSALRQRRRVQTGSQSGVEIYHYAAGSDGVAWIDRGSGWSRNVAGIGGELAAVQDSGVGTSLQLTNLHGDVVATASLDPEATNLLATFESDEYGNPKQGSTPRYGWLGGKQRRTELPSGVIQMGVRSYVPAIGRFLSPDPVQGGSANAYEYAAGDPVNNYDLTGEKCVGSRDWIKRCKAKKTIAWMERSNKNRAVIMKFKSRRAAEYFAYSLSKSYIEELEAKAGKWKREELANLYKKARESRIRGSLLPTDPFDCDDLSIAGGLVGLGLTLARVPGGVALIFASAGIGSDIASKAGAC